MTRLSTFDPRRNPYPPGTRVRLRPVEDWAGSDAGLTRPIRCEYYDMSGALHSFLWDEVLDAGVGLEFEVITSACSLGLPMLHVGGRDWICHPDFLELVEAPDPPCLCPTWSLLNIGCKCQPGRQSLAIERTRLRGA